MQPELLPLVVQHNALVNARFSFSTLETRLFLALLVRINRGDTSFSVYRIPVKELAPDSSSNALYADVDEMTKKLAARVLHIEVLGPNGERVKQPDRINRPLMYQCDYIKSEGVVEARFSDGVRDYLLDLRHNFTQAQLPQLLMIRSAAAHRIYWLVKEYAQQGKTQREIEVSELRKVLGLTTEYVNRFDHFKVRVLDRAQAELATTDLPFTMEFIRHGKAVHTIRFLFAATAKTLLLAAPEEDSWQALLIRTGISGKSLLVIQAKLDAGDYTEGYIRYVVTTIEAQVAAGKVKKLAGAVFKALTDSYLLPAYEKQQQPQPKTAKSESGSKTKFTKSGASIAGARNRLNSELQDAYGTLNFVTSSAVYTEETRPAAIQTLQTKIDSLKEQLAKLEA
jgi:hypothetical protein